MEAEARATPRRLTPRQSSRRQRILDAALALAAEGGYDAVQMRDVAERADVALGTLYRYFGSKDQLLAAVWQEWSTDVETRVGKRPLRGDTMAERASDFLRRATLAVEREPTLASALILSAASPDPRVNEHQRDVASMMTRVLTHAMADLDPEEVRGIREVIGHVWYSSLMAWVNGRTGIDAVYNALDTACHLLLDPREATRS
jgi:AcrR family transcriptional regulator